MKNLYLSFFLLAISTILSVQSKAQDYKISFGICDHEEYPDSVVITNLDQSTTVTLFGNDTLHLVGSQTSIHSRNFSFGKPKIFPNPMLESATIEFYNNNDGDVSIEITGVTGKKVAQLQQHLPEGRYSCKMNGINKGVYIISVVAGDKKTSEILVSQAANNAQPSLILLANGIFSQEFKGGEAILSSCEMEYVDGERIKFIAYKNNDYEEEIIIPNQSEKIVFGFIDSANFISSQNIVPVSKEISFTHQANIGNTTSWDWDFGDGNFSTEQNPQHNYETVGYYSVTLTIENSCDSETKTKTDFIEVYDITGYYNVETRRISTSNDTTYHYWEGDIITNIDTDQYRTRSVGHWEPGSLGGTPGFTFIVDEMLEITIPEQDLVEMYSNTLVGTKKGTLDLETGIINVEYSIAFPVSGGGYENGYYKSTYTPME